MRVVDAKRLKTDGREVMLPKHKHSSVGRWYVQGAVRGDSWRTRDTTLQKSPTSRGIRAASDERSGSTEGQITPRGGERCERASLKCLSQSPDAGKTVGRFASAVSYHPAIREKRKRREAPAEEIQSLPQIGAFQKREDYKTPPSPQKKSLGEKDEEEDQ